MTHAVIGIFDNRSEAEAAMAELTQRGFTSGDIDISRRVQGSTGTGSSGSYGTTGTGTGVTGTGTTSAGVSGGTGTTGSGYDRTDSSSYSDNDSFGDKVSNFFSSLFGDDSDEVSRYSSVASEADAILTVQTDSDEKARQAAEIMDRNGAIDVDDRATQAGYNMTNRGSNTDTDVISGRSGYDRDTDRTGEKNLNIPVVEEDLHVGKRQVESGGVRVKSRIVEKPVEEHVRLREEHVNVNRHPVNREVRSGEFESFKEGEFEIREHAEKPVVSKEARVTEEVSINKSVEEHDEVVRDTVRSTDVDVQKIKGDVRTGATATDRTDDDDDRSTGFGNNARTRGA